MFIQSSKQFRKCQFDSFAQWNVLVTSVVVGPFCFINISMQIIPGAKIKTCHCSLINHLHNLATFEL